jgi:GDPmannose 4,6-dehydratase
MLQQEQADDFVIATGEQHSVREFVERAAAELGIGVGWEGEGVDEVGKVVSAPEGSPLQKGQAIVAVDPRYFRPAEVETLLGDPTKAKEKLGWVPKIGFAELVREMVHNDLSIAKRDALVRGAGYRTFSHHE